MSRVIIEKNIRGNLLRTFLTVLGIAIGVSAVVGLLSISLGMGEYVTERVSRFGQNMIMITPGAGGMASVAFNIFSEGELSVIENTVGVTRAIPRYTDTVSAKYKNKNFDVRIVGISGNNLAYIIEQETMSLSQGSAFSAGKNLILGRNTWRDLDKPGIGQSLYLKGEKFKIVGIATPSGQPFVDAGVFLPIEEAWVLAGVDEEYSLITAYVTDPSVAGRIKQRLKNYRGNEDFQVMTSEQLLEQAQTILSMVNGFLLAITSVSLIVGILGIANTMFVSITERVKQIGVMKTLGATNNRILSMILQESAVLGLFGGIAGCILGVILGNAVALVASFYDVTLYVLVPPWVFAVVIFSTVVLGTLSGFIPAYQASKLDPVEALKG